MIEISYTEVITAIQFLFGGLIGLYQMDLTCLPENKLFIGSITLITLLIMYCEWSHVFICHYVHYLQLLSMIEY